MTRADNQQERLNKETDIVFIGWITGFVDGEGCFSIGFVRQPDRQDKNRIRRGYRTGYQVFHEFSVTQGAKSKASLIELQKFFGAGNIYLNKRYDNHKEHLYRYTVRKRSDLVNIIIPFFKLHPLRTSKRHDFEKFARCIKMVNRKEHLTKEGIIKIARIAMTTNHQKPRDPLIRILRYYTPTSEKESG